MPGKTPAIISAIITFLLLIVLAVISVLFEMLALNGASERQGTMIMGTSIVCQGVGALLLAFLASRLTNMMITKFKWNTILAVILAVIAAILIGLLISFLTFIISIPLAGIR